MPEKPTDEEIEAEMFRIRAMEDPAAQAEAFTRLMWRCGELPERHAWIALDYAYSGPHRRSWAEPFDATDHRPSDHLVWLETADPIERDLWESFWQLRDQTYGRGNRWWREQNLPVELAKAETRQGFVAQLTELFRRVKKPRQH